jgi:hypothetical protein
MFTFALAAYNLVKMRNNTRRCNIIVSFAASSESLGVGPRVWRLLLGARHMGAAAPGRAAMDSGLLGLGRQRVHWNPGYWALHIGFYGGVNYGYGYTGNGYEGGYWNNGAYFYNRYVNNIGNVPNITNVYNTTVITT